VPRWPPGRPRGGSRWARPAGGRWKPVHRDPIVHATARFAGMNSRGRPRADVARSSDVPGEAGYPGARPPRDGDGPATHSEVGLPWRTAPARRPHGCAPMPGRTRPQGPALLSARPRDLHQRSSSRPAAGPGGRQLAATRDKSRSYVPGPPAPNGPAGAGRPVFSGDDSETGTKHDVREIQVRCLRRNSWETSTKPAHGKHEAF
jgi:hypothetical protein